MDHVISLSLSDRAFQLVYAQTDDSSCHIVKAEEHLYKDDYRPDMLFNEANIRQIADAISALKQESGITENGIIVALPFNQAYTKNVIYPSDETKEEIRQHIAWEFSHSLPEEIDKYRVSVLKQIERDKAISEATVVAISKSMLKTLKEMADNTQSQLQGILINCFSLENYLLREKELKPGDNFIVIKLGEYYLEHHIFFSGNYYSSYVDSIAPTADKSRLQNISDLTRERYKQISQLTAQLPFVNTPTINIIVFGSALTNKDFDTIVSGISSPVSKARLNELPGRDAFKYLEAYGSIL